MLFKDQRLLVLLAHPDDEFGLFPLFQITELRQRIEVAWLTDGGWGGQSIARRREESVATLSELGVDPSRMHFLGEQWKIPDGDLYRRVGSASDALLSHFRNLEFTTIVMPAWEGGHADHDACHLIGIAFAKSKKLHALQFSLYQGEGLPGPLFKLLCPLRLNGPCIVLRTSLSQRLGYVLRCLNYRSQWRSFLGLLPMYCLRMMTGQAFRLQALIDGRVAEKPHLGKLLYERRGGPSWEEFAAITTKFRA